CSYTRRVLYASPFFLHCPAAHPHLHSFPTRRSSDLYLLTMKPLDAHIRTANPYLAGWVAALICYPPFILMDGPLNYHVNTADWRSEEHTSELQSRENLVCRLLLEKKKNTTLLKTQDY